MKSLHNLPIKAKFGIVIIPLILIILLFDVFQIKHHYLDFKDSNRLNKAIILGVEINHVVHEIQKERGITAGFLSSNASEFGNELSAQRLVTDSTLQVYYQEIKRNNLADLLKLHRKDLDKLDNFFSKILELRKAVDSQSLTTDQAINSYADINTNALLTVNSLINETRDKKITQQVHAMIYFLESKEIASIERAVGTQLFSLDVRKEDVVRKFAQYVAQQDAYIQSFVIISDSESESYYHNIVEGKEVDEVNRLREIILSRSGEKENPNYWYKVKTGKINSLKKVEDYLSANILAETELVADNAKFSLWGFLVLDILIGIVALLITWTIASNLLGNVQKLENFTQKITDGDLSQKIVIGSKDEIGKYATTFNSMIEEVNRLQAETSQARDRATEMYENTYKQSEVILENVQQGIFLLDKEFRISNQYSKAMEVIFDNLTIANENFASFMRPLVIPRDLEALEMFMRHLFNDDMDEDVVNQLNPVEQVKIFTDNEGIITTKYVRILFSRVIREGEIQNILVTISDETESVLLQQHIDEAEANKKVETEQLLSILKIDPSLLRGFLFNSRKGLRSISEEFEKNGESDMDDLLTFSFQAIHNIKGNASLIGLQMVTDKLHAIEETISGMRQKSVNGNDFLSLLFEIDELDKVLVYMSELLRKVADIYKNFPKTGHVVSNILVIDSLEKGLHRISKEIGKDVNFDFENEKNIVIPDNYITPFKDIMIQLIRNSLAHGIEQRGERLSLHKIEKGNISITLDQETENEMIIIYFDDGSGLDLKKIQESAISKGIIAHKMESSEKIVELLFNSGFSTADHIDEYSGRGEGLGLVKSIIHEHNGTFLINSEHKKFFEMVIKFPINDQSKTESEV